MKLLVPTLILSLVLLPLLGCIDYRTETSGVLHEPAKVVCLIYTPSRHDSSIGLSAINVAGDDDDIGLGLDWGGNLGVRYGSFQVSSSEVPEQWGVLFQCKHGQFTSQGADERHHSLYNKLRDGQLVDVTYKEIYKLPP
jgi:hypothetical protein